MRRRLRLILPALLAAAFVLISIYLTLRAISGEQGPAFDYADWADIFSFAVAAFALAFYILDRHNAANDRELTAAGLAQIEDDLAHEVLRRESDERARLLGIDRPTTHTVELRFERAIAWHPTAGGTESGTLSRIRPYFMSLNPKRLVILGTPGAGKTVLATELVVQLLEHRASTGDKVMPIPIKLPISSLETGQRLEEWLVIQLMAAYRLSRSAAASLVTRRRILPVLDGLDEMDADGTDQTRTRNAVMRINTYFAGSQNAPVVVTCRAEDYSRLAERVHDATPVELLALDADQISTYLASQLQDPDAELAWLQISEALREGPTSHTGQAVTGVLSTPWTLTLAVTAFRDGADPGHLIPASADPRDMARVRGMLLARFIPAMVRLHPKAHETPHDADTVTQWLRTIAAHLSWQEQQERSGTDIVLHTWWPIAGVKRTRWLHTVAVAVVTLTGIGCIIGSFAGRMTEFLGETLAHMRHPSQLEAPYLLAVIAVGIGTVALPVIGAWTVFRAEPQPCRLDLRQLRSRRGLRRLAAGAAVGAVASVTIGVALGVTGGVAADTPTIIVWFAMAGTAAGAAFGLLFGLDNGSADAVGPREILAADLRYGAASGLLVGSIGALAGAIAIGPRYGIAVGIAVSIIHGLLLGPVAAARYGIAMSTVAARGVLPLRLGHFLAWASNAGLMRVTGIAYQFRHRELQQWLLTSAPEPEPLAEVAGQ